MGRFTFPVVRRFAPAFKIFALKITAAHWHRLCSNCRATAFASWPKSNDHTRANGPHDAGFSFAQVVNAESARSRALVVPPEHPYSIRDTTPQGFLRWVGTPLSAPNRFPIDHLKDLFPPAPSYLGACSVISSEAEQ